MFSTVKLFCLAWENKILDLPLHLLINGPIFRSLSCFLYFRGWIAYICMHSQVNITTLNPIFTSKLCWKKSAWVIYCQNPTLTQHNIRVEVRHSSHSNQSHRTPQNWVSWVILYLYISGTADWNYSGYGWFGLGEGKHFIILSFDWNFNCQQELILAIMDTIYKYTEPETIWIRKHEKLLLMLTHQLLHSKHIFIFVCKRLFLVLE